MKKILLFVPIAAAFVTLTSCGDGWKETEKGVEYKFIEHDENAKKPALGDVLIINMSMTSEEDSLLMSTEMAKSRMPGGKHKLLLQKPAFYGDPLEALALMNVGDSIIIKIPADSIFKYAIKRDMPPFIAPGSKLIMNVKVLASQTQAEADKEDEMFYKEEMAKVEDKMKKLEEAEPKLLADYLAANKVTVKPTASGLYYIETKKGTGPQAVKGKKVSVAYKGTFFDGKPFDSSEGRGPYTFVLGNAEVIPGWDEGIALMKEGGKANLIVPSSVGYGAQGNPPVIPPYTPLLFEVELVKVGE